MFYFENLISAFPDFFCSVFLIPSTEHIQENLDFFEKIYDFNTFLFWKFSLVHLILMFTFSYGCHNPPPKVLEILKTFPSRCSTSTSFKISPNSFGKPGRLWQENFSSFKHPPLSRTSFEIFSIQLKDQVDSDSLPTNLLIHLLNRNNLLNVSNDQRNTDAKLIKKKWITSLKLNSIHNQVLKFLQNNIRQYSADFAVTPKVFCTNVQIFLPNLISWTLMIVMNFYLEKDTFVKNVHGTFTHPDYLPSSTATLTRKLPSTKITKVIIVSVDLFHFYPSFPHPHWHPSQKKQSCKKTIDEYFVNLPQKIRLIPKSNPFTHVARLRSAGNLRYGKK